VHLRNSGFKLAPVDANHFPRGFNNLNKENLPLCVRVAMTAIELEQIAAALEQQRFPQVRAANN
jgi:glutamate-cysteine ligase